MRSYTIAALVALNICVCLAVPQNRAKVEEKTAVAPAAAKAKGAYEVLDGMQNDQYTRTCTRKECSLILARDAKGLAKDSIMSVATLKGNDEMTKALSPSVDTLMASMKGLDAQKAMLENLQQQMASLNSAFGKGEQLAENAKAQFAEAISKGANLPAAPMYKGAPMPPSKGGSAAATMQLEATMCPMLMFELGQTQKRYKEAKQQLENANVMNAMLQSQKNNLENALAMCEVAKTKAQEQAAFNAKYAAEQKNRADSLAARLAIAEAEKAALQKQKAELESDLAATRRELVQEKQTSAALSSALQACTEEKAQLQEEKDALINELKATQDTLRETQIALEDEQISHARTRRELADTQEELAASEAARRQLEEAKQELEDELAETKDQLAAMTAERDQLQVTLDATSAMLASCTEEKFKCQSDLAECNADKEQLTKQLTDALLMLSAEKKAREELTATIMMVKAASEKVQEEVRRLQIENLGLQQQVAKLRAEQGAALAMAAGCPPTYEKFGLSCYKYIREKTQWKMAQEQCMKDGGNLVSIESRQEQIYLIDYLKRHGAADSDAYSHTSGNKRHNKWYWLGGSDTYVGQTGPQYWFNEITKMKPSYDCQAMYLRDSSQYGKWVGLPCYNAAPFTCEYRIAPPGTIAPPNAGETLAMAEMYKNAPAYMGGPSMSKGSMIFRAPSLSKGAPLSFASKGQYRV